MAESIRIAAVSGSLRKGSLNTAALHAAADRASPGTEVDIITLHGLPLFNEDVEAEGWPEEVAKLRSRIEAADGILFATPEYNYSFTGVLKNAIDWLSRPPGQGPVTGKPAAILGASPGPYGTARAQTQLREVLYYNDMPLLPDTEVMIYRAGEKFDKGRLADDETAEFMQALMRGFEAWIVKHRA